MLAKLTSSNQLTLPKSITETLGLVEYFDVTVQNGKIILTPIETEQADVVRAKLAELQLTANDIAEAITWARQP